MVACSGTISAVGSVKKKDAKKDLRGHLTHAAHGGSTRRTLALDDIAAFLGLALLGVVHFPLCFALDAIRFNHQYLLLCKYGLLNEASFLKITLGVYK